jgi:hypothetical protein
MIQAPLDRQHHKILERAFYRLALALLTLLLAPGLRETRISGCPSQLLCGGCDKPKEEAAGETWFLVS